MLLIQLIECFRKHMISIDKALETIKGYGIELNLLNRYLSEKYNGLIYVEDIAVQDLEEYLSYLKDKGYAPASRSRTIYIIRAFYNFCYKKEYISKNIAVNLEAVPVPEKERVYLSQEEMKSLIGGINSPIIKLIVNTLFFTGMRISECLNLLLKDVDLKEGIITVRNTKNKQDRQIPIHKDLAEAFSNYIKNWRNGAGNPYFFCLNSLCRISPDHVNKVLHKTTESLKMDKHVTCHIIRHSFASCLVARNINIVNIQKLLGHKDLSTTSIYTHTNLVELKKAVNTI